MLKRFFPFIVALLMLIIADVMLGLPPIQQFLDAHVRNVLDSRWKELDTFAHQPVDVLALGTSKTNMGFEPTAFEAAWSGKAPHSFSMGLPSGDYYILQLFLTCYIQQVGKPKLILLEVSPLLFKPHIFADSNNMLYLNTVLNRAPHLLKGVWRNPQLSFSDKNELILSAFSRLYRYRSVIGLQNLFKYFTATFYNQTGQKLFSDDLDPHPLLRKHLQGFQYVQNTRLISLLQYCKKQNILVLLIDWPVHPNYTSLFEKQPISNSYYDAVRTTISETKVSYINLNKNIPNSMLKEGFRDAYHLSSNGAQYFSMVLGHEIQSQNLPNNRSSE